MSQIFLCTDKLGLHWMDRQRLSTLSRISPEDSPRILEIIREFFAPSGTIEIPEPWKKPVPVSGFGIFCPLCTLFCTFHVQSSLPSFCTQFALFCKYSEECKRGQDVGIRRAMGLGNMQVAKKMQKEGKKRKKRHNLRGHNSGK